jgi:glycosyltransferase involved in cell wall biosynthesis
MKPHLLLVTPTYVAYKVFLRGLAATLQKQGWRVDLACSTLNYPATVDEEQGICMHEIDFPRGNNPLAYWKGARQLRNLVRQLQPNLIHVHFSSAILVAAIARDSLWPTTIATYQGLVHPMQQGWRRWLYGRLERWSAARMDGVWVLTPDDLHALRGIPQARIQKAKGFGFDRDRFDPARFTPEQRDQQRRQWGIPTDALVFGYVGRFVKFKGFATVAQAALNVCRQHPHVHFLLVGTRDPLHPSGVSDVDWSQLQNTPQIHFAGWTDNVPLVLRAVDCLVFPSVREGMAVCIMEALGMGVPVITTAARGCGELVQNGKNGWIVEQTTQSVQTGIERIIAQPQWIAEASQRALASSQSLGRETFINEQIGIYEECLDLSSFEPASNLGESTSS